MKTQKSSCSAPMQGSNKEKQSLFDTIIDSEMQSLQDYDCQKHANRVGVFFKVLFARDLWSLRLEFEKELTALLRKFSERIDNELHQASKVEEPEV